jgi:regulator of protease activity HflC (stomatin/prohibitin superfamily)
MKKFLSFLVGLIGFHFVPENHKAAVMRFGMYHRARGPGFIWIIPFVERVENLVKIGVRFATFTVRQVFSSNGIPFAFELAIRYRFDPDSTSSRSIAAQLVRLPDHFLDNIVMDHADRSLRRTVAQYGAEDICTGGPIAAIEQDVMEGLQAQIRHLGLAPTAGSGVMIKEVTPPPDFLESVLAAKGHELVLRVLTAYREADVDQALYAKLVSSLGKGDGSVFLSSLSDFLKRPGAQRSDEK